MMTEAISRSVDKWEIPLLRQIGRFLSFYHTNSPGPVLAPSWHLEWWWGGGGGGGVGNNND